MTRLSHALITRCVQLNDVFFQQYQRAFERIRQFLGREKQNQKSFSSSAPLRSLSHIGCSQYHLLVIIRHNGNHFGDFEQSRTFFLNEFTSSHCVRGEGPPPLSAPDVLSCLILEEKYQVDFEIELIGERFLFFLQLLSQAKERRLLSGRSVRHRAREEAPARSDAIIDAPCTGR